MTFVPATLYSNPVYRGLYVQKVIQAIDVDSGLPTGPPLRAARLGQMVAVTLQLTTADDVRDVELEDWVPGGLEPVDPHVDSSTLNANSNCGGMYSPMRGGGGGYNGGGYNGGGYDGGGGGMVRPGGGPMMGGGPMGGRRQLQMADFGAYYYWWSCTSFQRTTKTDRVSFYSQFVRAGTHSVTYQAMAATSGQFVLPPAKAALVLQVCSP